jgi:hypothetical protein
MIGSFSVVANDRAKREVALMIKSVRQFYDCPVYVMCDEATKEYLSSLELGDVECKLELTDDKLAKKERLVSHVTKQNDFHSMPIILTKMDCIEWALWEVGDTFFVDADITIVRPLHEELDRSMDLFLSPHFHVEDKTAQNKKYGSFNAGYLWTKSMDFPQAWRDVYLTRSTFYEQEGMRHFWESFDIKTFGKEHNLGFWRFPKVWTEGVLSLVEPTVNWDEVKSVHFHSDPLTYAHADPGLIKGYDLLKGIMVSRLPKNLTERILELCESD